MFEVKFAIYNVQCAILKAIGIIPARYQSTRLPHKPLVLLLGKPLIVHVWERARTASSLSDVVVATDHPEIKAVVERAGGKVVMTGEHRTGTDRVAEAAESMKADLIVNIQGDEPLIDPSMIDEAIRPFGAESLDMATLIHPMTDFDDLANPHVVKVIVNQKGFAIYFSRSPVPYPYDVMVGGGSNGGGEIGGYWKHIGLYVYRREFLQTFTRLPKGKIEETERLEQLRALEYGYSIKAVETAHTSLGVDTPEDVKKVEALMRERQ